MNIRRVVIVPLTLLLLSGLTGCTVLSVVDAAASTVVDVAVGTVKTTGKVIGKTIDVVTPGDDDD